MRAVSPSAEEIARRLRGNAVLTGDELYLRPGACTLRLRSNSARLIGRLRAYFDHVAAGPRDVDVDVVAIEGDAPDLNLDFTDWKREPGKSGRKDAYVDLLGGRLVLKVRTGMVFLQSEAARIAAGPCLRHDNQVINFINAQYMNWLQNRGWLICHAAALVRHGRCLAIAGFSGGGKSTLMLRLMDDASMSYLTNDRLFIRRNGATTAVGIPKLPRVNPGTIVHNASLHSLMTVDQRDAYLALPPDELWRVEEKFDVHVDRLYGKGRIVGRAPVRAFLVLNWDRADDRPVSVDRVDPAARRDLLAAIMKSPGPFHQFADGRFFTDTMALDEDAYLRALDGVALYEAKGGVDFDALRLHCVERLMESEE